MADRRRKVLCISIHALRKESDQRIMARFCAFDISIHALRKESDRRPAECADSVCISIHALRKESDRIAGESCRHARHFNPRSP